MIIPILNNTEANLEQRQKSVDTTLNALTNIVGAILLNSQGDRLFTTEFSKYKPWSNG